MENLSTISYLDQLVDVIKSIDTTDLSDDVDKESISKVIEEQKVYFWIRLYLKEEDSNLEIGDDISIKWTPTGEELKTKFICFGKTGLQKDYDEEIVNYNSEDDKKVLCLMVDEGQVNYNEDIPFVRTLINPMIGIIGIPNKVFALWNILGAIVWTDGILLLGYLLGEKIEGSVDKYLLPIVGLIIFLSLVPIALEILRERKRKKE